LNITLRDITRDNWLECVRLKVAQDQLKYVATNAVSLAQSKYEPESVPLASYDGDTMVGFVMYRPEDYEMSKLWFIERLMVGLQYQGKGYGRATMEALLARLKGVPGYAAVLISFIPDNEAAQKLYSSLGFVDTGEIEEGELVYRLGL
jgi:diamine N-acetyltransferase